MLTVDAIRSYGANVDEGLGRCMNNADFYLRLVKMAAADEGFDKLKDALERHALDEAFEAAHALKGVCANLSLTPLLTPVSEVTELLRARTETDYGGCLSEILAQRDRLKELCAD